MHITLKATLGKEVHVQVCLIFIDEAHYQLNHVSYTALPRY